MGLSNASANARRLVDDLAPCVGLLCDGPQDAVLVSDQAVPRQLPPLLNQVHFVRDADLTTPGTFQFSSLQPWGLSEPAIAMARRLRLHLDHSAIAAVATVNSRRFQNQFDCVRSCTTGDVNAQPFSTLCDSLPAVQQWLSVNMEEGKSWVAKAEFSQAARNRLIGRTPSLDSKSVAWLGRQLSASGVVSMEPWVQRAAELGIQMQISASPEKTKDCPDDYQISCAGLTECINTSGGQYIGSLLKCSSVPWNSWSAAVQHAETVCDAAARAGYRGFLGIDCMIYNDSCGQSWLRMAHDLNGRCTMGRVALALQKHLRTDECGFWVHLPADLSDPGRFPFAECLSSDVSTIRTSPLKIGDRNPQMITWLLATKDRDEILHAVSVCRTHRSR